ncbi:MAG: LysR family transcriptional regulator [Clostridia bacterium]|jgi:LysR family cyn operon transcriptional activator|nr:LysR family transcriptional regulator [Clostridia bacterium]MCX4366969.1 LysR family transcriptional regulator [Clostridia bacterium]
MSFINYELYRIFYVVAKSGSITKAAQELFISQPAVSQSIKQLETQIGGRLFVRTSKGMELTYEGKIIFEYIEQANVLIGIAEKKFSQLKELTYGEIKIGASDTVTKHFLLKYIRKFIEKYPDVNVNITNRTTFETLNLLKAGKVDIAFINGPIGDEYVEESVCEAVNDIFVASENAVRDIKRPLTMRELAERKLIMLEKGSNTRKVIDKSFQDNGVTLSPTLELASIDLMADMAVAGLGIACVPDFVAESYLRSGQLKKVEIDFDMPKRNLSLATLKGTPLSFSAKEFVKLIMRKG